MILYLGVLIVFSLHRESLKLILVDKPLPEVVLSHFAWKILDMPEIPREVIEHKLEIYPSFKADQVEEKEIHTKMV
jgi:hypothetical protein